MTLVSRVQSRPFQNLPDVCFRSATHRPLMAQNSPSLTAISSDALLPIPALSSQFPTLTP